MDELPLTQLVEIGTNGLAIALVWSLIKTNEQLMKEIRQHNNLLAEIINKLIEDENRNS